MIIRANQTLTFENNTQLILPAGATIILEEGATIEGPTNRSGSLISIGGNEIWGNSCADCTEGPLTGPGTMDQNSDPASPLPIELLYFKGRATAEGYALEWATVSEENFDYFTLERSTNAADFYPVGTIKGHGNSTSTLVYKYLDKEAPEGISYYRLKATDFDGYTEYFKIISLHKELREKLAEVYPNPVDEGILRVLTHPKVQEAVLQLQDMSGHTVYSEVLANSSEEIILNNNIRPGTYLLSIKGQNINHIQLLIVN
ncbi:MAG: T9SS type A sorting domain-containing protein [Cyclobacteriaceae bacterium]